MIAVRWRRSRHHNFFSAVRRISNSFCNNAFGPRDSKYDLNAHARTHRIYGCANWFLCVASKAHMVSVQLQNVMESLLLLLWLWLLDEKNKFPNQHSQINSEYFLRAALARAFSITIFHLTHTPIVWPFILPQAVSIILCMYNVYIAFLSLSQNFVIHFSCGPGMRSKTSAMMHSSFPIIFHDVSSFRDRLNTFE